MSDISGVRRDVRLTAAFLELLGTVGKCLELPHQGRDEGDISEHYHRDVVLAHISMCLGIASESASVPEAFIAELEALCKWPISPPSFWTQISQFPQIILPLPVRQHNRPKLWLSDEVRMHAQESFLAYASSRAEDQDALAYFRPRNPSELVKVNTSQVSSQCRAPPEDYPDFVAENLYTTLAEYSRCHCSNDTDQKQARHEARLCLHARPICNREIAGYNLHFSSISTQIVMGSHVPWQQICFRVPKTRPGLQTVGFSESAATSNIREDTASETDLPMSDRTLVRRDAFCKLLRTNRGEVQISLQVEPPALYRSRYNDAPDQQLLPKSSISLAEILTSYELSSKAQFALAYVLALSVWKFYDSTWMTASWSTHSIHFMQEYEQPLRNEPFVTCRPCLTVRFDSASDANLECCNLLDISHYYPRILSLGTMLVQIGWGDTIDDLEELERRGHNSARTLNMINNECTWGKSMCRNADWPRIGLNDTGAANTRGIFREATIACFDKSLFTPKCDSCNIRQGDGETISACAGCIGSRRNILLTKVVLPLRDALYALKWETVLEKPDVIPAKPAETQRAGLRSQLARSRKANDDTSEAILLTTRQGETERPTNFHHDVPLGVSAVAMKEKCAEYRHWKSSLIKAIKPFEEKKRQGTPRVKIAVFDTGLDKSHPGIEDHLGRIMMYNQKPAKGSSPDKTTPHGMESHGAHDKPTEPSQPDQASIGDEKSHGDEDELGEFKSAEVADMDDKEGHGTHIAGLVLEYAQDACLYVANVSINGSADRSLLARAIRAAVKEKVDIISISIGFEEREHPDALEHAIEFAKSAHVHVFASAGNSGGNRDRTWPARFNNIFCIHSTNWWGTGSDFNPSEREKNDNDFSTIGEAVESCWPESLSEGLVDGEVSTMSKSGTSFSTPIAACIAAFVLRYARMELCRVDADRLRYHAVLREVLTSLAVKRNGFHYLTVRSDHGELFDPRENVRQKLADIIQRS